LPAGVGRAGTLQLDGQNIFVYRATVIELGR
jgi:hypothetical protein